MVPQVIQYVVLALNNLVAGIAESSRPLVSVYLNPASDYLILTGEAADRATKCVIVNSIGQEVLAAEINPGENRIDLNGLPEGVYYLRRAADSSATPFIVHRE